MTFDGAVIVRSRGSGLVALASLCVLGVSAVAAAFGIEAAMVGLYTIYPITIAGALHLGWVRAMPRAARLDVSGARVSVGGRALRSRLVSAKIIPRARQGPLIELRRRLDPYPARVSVATEEDARAFVRALGLDPREGRTRFRPPMSAWMWLLLIVGAYVGTVMAAAVSPLMVALLIPAMMLAVRLFRRTVTIGQDGILLEGLPRRRFIPYASIANIEREVRYNRKGPTFSRGFWIELRSGKRLFMNTLNERLREGMLEGDHLFEAAKVAHHFAKNTHAPTADMLVRGSRPTREWLTHLKTLGEARYRVAAVGDDQLLSVLCDPNAESTARAAAAVCLSGAGEDARVKVRVAVEDIAAPAVRAAALAALGDDETALVETLEAL